MSAILFRSHYIKWVNQDKDVFDLAETKYLSGFSVHQTPKNKLESNINQHTNIFFQENAFENVVFKMSANLFRSHYIKWVNQDKGVFNLSETKYLAGKPGTNRGGSFSALFINFHRVPMVKTCPEAARTSLFLEQKNLSDYTNTLRPNDITSQKFVILGSGNGLLLVRHQAITWTKYGLLSIGWLGTKFGEIKIIKVLFPSKTIHFKMLSAKWQPFRLGLIALNGLMKIRINWIWHIPRHRVKILMLPYQYSDHHVKDKTVSQPSSLESLTLKNCLYIETGLKNFARKPDTNK